MTDTNTYQQKLAEEKVSLEAELSTIAQPSEETPGTWEAVEKGANQEADPNDLADHLDEYQENRAIVDVLNARYQEVTAALQRIQDGTYGVCEVGGEKIEDQRLAADPAAKTCIAHVE
jgi:DnaK suppressor protein